MTIFQNINDKKSYLIQYWFSGFPFLSADMRGYYAYELRKSDMGGRFISEDEFKTEFIPISER